MFTLFKKYKLLLFIVACGITINSALFSQTPIFQWAKSMGNSSINSSDVGFSVAADSYGNVYVTGIYNGIVDFDPGVSVMNLFSVGNNDVFILKLDANGNLIWGKSLGGVNNDVATALTIDSFGDIYITGSYEGTVDFDPGTATVSLTSAGLGDIFIEKMDSNGNFIWVKSIGGIGYDVSYGLKTDNSGAIYCTGYYSNTVDFDPGTGVNNLTAIAGSDAFIQKIDGNGNFVWAKSIGGTGSDIAQSLAVDSIGAVYITGNYWGTIDFDPGIGTVNSTAVGYNDIFILKLDVNGNLVWANSFGDTNFDKGMALAIDRYGDIYITGDFGNTVDFNPGIGINSLTAVANRDIFIQKLDANGNLIWVKSMGGMGYEIGNTITTDTSGNIYTAGSFGVTVDFDPGLGVANLSAAGGVGGEIFIQKLDSNGNFLWAKSMGGTVNGDGDAAFSLFIDINENIYTTGEFEGTGDFDTGIGVFNLSSNGLADIFIHKINQCNTSSSIISPVTCTGSYTSPSGNYTWTASGNYVDTIINFDGCDSIITINLTVQLVDVAVTSSGSLLTSNATGATYQWIDCSNGFSVILGENNQNFNPSINGSYAVIITQNGCLDTSSCYNITSIGIKENNFSNVILFPNPTKGDVFLDFEKQMENVTIYIKNNLGQAISTKKYAVANNIYFTIEGEKGMYFIEVVSANEKSIMLRVQKN